MIVPGGRQGTFGTMAESPNASQKHNIEQDLGGTQSTEVVRAEILEEINPELFGHVKVSAYGQG